MAVFCKQVNKLNYCQVGILQTTTCIIFGGGERLNYEFTVIILSRQINFVSTFEKSFTGSPYNIVFLVIIPYNGNYTTGTPGVSKSIYEIKYVVHNN